MARGDVHHVELWVPDLGRAILSFGWLLEVLGYAPLQDWKLGRSWILGTTYVVIEQSPALSSEVHDRNRPGLNHLAFHVGTRTECDRVATEAGDHGWVLLFPDRHPYAGGPDHYAAYMTNSDGFEIELVAADSG